MQKSRYPVYVHAQDPLLERDKDGYANVPTATMQYMARHQDPATTDPYKRVSRLKGIGPALANRLYG